MKTLRFIGMVLMAVFLCVNFTSCSKDNDDDIFSSGGGNNIGGGSNIPMNTIRYQTTDNIIIRFENEDVFGGAKIINNTYSTTNNYGTIEFASEVTAIEQKAFYEQETLSSITIPNSVTSIGQSAFEGCTNLTSVTIGNGVTSIGESAFHRCTGLTNVEFSNGVTSIGNNAFYYCTGLTNIELPNSVTYIGSYAFYGCSLTSITIPNSVTIIGGDAFNKCSNLKEVHISDIAAWCNIHFISYTSNPLYYVKDLYLNGELVKDLIIPEGVENIRQYAFYDYGNLTSVTIPNSVTSIGNNAFYGCYDLTSITIGNGVTSIGYRAFDKCTYLEEVHISDIAAWCNIDFETHYDSGFFVERSNPLRYAKNLYLNGELLTNNLILPEGTKIIKQYAFCHCKITSVTIPNSVTAIESHAFKNKDLKEIHISNIAAWCNIDFEYDVDANLFDYANLYLNGELVTDLVIPEGVKKIKEYAFYNCDKLTSVIIPNTVTSIGEKAFYGCTGLTSITIPESVTYIVYNAFDYDLKDMYVKRSTPAIISTHYNISLPFKNVTLYVPKGSLSAYKSANGWKEIKNIQEWDAN